nr:deoxynucleotidyltransferase terminal-interacting protein 2 [Misgurnus anguillicaudatus]
MTSPEGTTFHVIFSGKMVATRRGTRVGSPVKNKSDESAGATVPNSSRPTRRKIVMEENETQSELTGDSQPGEPKDNSAAPTIPASPPKRETRRSTRRLVDKKQPDSTHEADVSDSESCCSVASNVQATPRTRRRTVARNKPEVPSKDDESEVESCSSAVSATRTRRSLRKRVQTPAASKAPKTEDGDLSEAESWSSAISLTKVIDTRRITRSRRKTAVMPKEADPSEPESCSSNVSCPRGSVVRRSTRIRKPTEPITLSLEDSTDVPSSPVSKRLIDRIRKTESGPAEEVCDSDECKSGPSMSPWRSGRRQTRRDAVVGDSDSESVATDVSLRGRGTPCSSRTGSASSSRAVPVTRTRSKASVTSDLVEEEEKGEEHGPLPSQSESVGAPNADDTEEPMDSTMTEEMATDITLVLDPDEPVQGSSDTLEPQHMPETEAPLGAVSVPDNATLEERCATEKQTHGEKAMDEMAVTEDKEEAADVAMENNEPEFVKAKDDAVQCLGEKDAEEIVCEEDVANKIVTASVDQTSILVNDAEHPCSSSQVDLTATEQLSKKISHTGKERISLLDSSEDEEGSDEGLSADEEEGFSQEAVDGICEEEMMSPDEGQSSVNHSNGLFVIDTRPGLQPDEKYYVDAKQIEDVDEEEFVDEEEDDDDEDSEALFTPRRSLTQFSSTIDPGLKIKELGGLYITFDGSKSKHLSSGLKTQDKNKVDELLKKSVIDADFEKKDAAPPYKESKNAAKLKRKMEREKTTGDGWFNMKAPELTEELKNDLKVLKMRSALDPKRFYKKNDREGFPKYFQVGTVVDSPVDYYSSRIPKTQRKRTVVEELLADAEFRSNNKKKYQEIMTEKAAQAAGKMNKKKHKFHKKKLNK